MATHNWMSFKGKSILYVDLSLQPLRDNKIQGFNGQTNQETTNGADKIKKNVKNGFKVTLGFNQAC